MKFCHFFSFGYHQSKWGYKTQEKGETVIENLSNTSNLVIFDTKTSKTKVIGSLEKHGARIFTFASEKIIGEIYIINQDLMFTLTG